jgi:hypothetical protein
MADITPTPEQVAMLIEYRTVGGGGTTGEWSENTHPTLDQVGEMCELAERDVMLALGNPVIPDELAEEGQHVSALRAAQAIELSYYPESSSTPTEQLTAAYLAGLEALKALLYGAAVRLR